MKSMYVGLELDIQEMGRRTERALANAKLLRSALTKIGYVST